MATRQPHDAHVVAEVLAAELRADAELLCEREHLGLERHVAEAAAAVVAGRRKRVEVARRGVLGGLERVLRAGSTDDDREVVGRARGRAERLQVLLEEGPHRLRVQERLGLLVEVALVRRASALGHEEQLVGVSVGRVELDLRGQVVARVLLGPHVERRELRVAEIERLVGLRDAARERRLVATLRQHVLTALAHHDGGARVLAHRQDATRRDVRVLEQVERDEAIVGRGRGVVEDPAQLGEVSGTELVRDVAHRLVRELRERLRSDLEERAAARLERADVILRDEPVRRLVLAEREDLLELLHRLLSSWVRLGRGRSGARDVVGEALDLIVDAHAASLPDSMRSARPGASCAPRRVRSVRSVVRARVALSSVRVRGAGAARTR
jgi:hypothetical protein